MRTERLRKSSPVFRLRLYLLLTVIELGILAIPLIRARSLDNESLWLGYSGPRLMLLAAWLFGFLASIWLLLVVFRITRPNNDTVPVLKIRERISANYAEIQTWLVTTALLSWSIVALFFLSPDFWSFLGAFLPVLFGQYWPVFAVVGFWAIQSLVLIRILKPDEVPSHATMKLAVPHAIQIFLLALLLYTFTAVELDLAPRLKTSYFPELAQAFLEGRYDLADPPATKDLTLFNGKYYVSFPPLGALLMMPLVARFGPEAVNVILFNSVFAALGVAFSFLMLEAMRERDLSHLNWWEHVLLALFLGFGTAQYGIAMRGLVNLTSQVLATTFLTISLWAAFGSSRRPEIINGLLAGSALGLAMLARPIVIFAWFVLAGIQWQMLQGEEGQFQKRFARWILFSLIPVIMVILALFWYNQVRFGSFLDFGYTRMLVADVLRPDLERYGQFHPHFISRNLYDNFLRLPYWEENCRMFAPDPQGTSILIASPLLIYLYLTFRKRIWIVGSGISIGLIALSHALYYSSGAVQFGYRFSLDFMPIIIALLAFGFGTRLPRTAIFLILFSWFMNFWGVLWIAHRLCENF